MKKIIILLLFIFLLTGCTSYTELNDLNIVSMMGIDYKNEKYELTIQVVNGKIDDSKIEKEITILTSKANTLEECFHNIYEQSSKKLYLSHIDLLVLTDNAINYNFKTIISHFIKNNEYRNNFNVIISNNLDEIITNIKTDDINHLLKTNKQEAGITTYKDFETILNEILIDNNTYLPTIIYQDNTILLDGYTLINNYKTNIKLTTTESILLNLLNNQINKTYLNNTNIFDNQTLLKINKNKITFQFLITVEKENNFTKDLEKDLQNFIKKYENNNIDILKMQEKVRKNNYSYYKKEKDNLLSKLKYNFQFKIKIRNTDLIGDDLIETK